MSPPLVVLAAPDKFKGSLNAPEAAEALAEGTRRACAGLTAAEVRCIPLADGGEGTVEALVVATNGSWRHAHVTGPLGAMVRAEFGMLGDGQTAVLEMAEASGLKRLGPHDPRDPTRTTTRGTGELLLAAIEAGARKVILGIGGSATNDGGAGMAFALGAKLLDVQGAELPPGGLALQRLDRIDVSKIDPRIREIEIVCACDVQNPLCGPLGASVVYGPQKGADAQQVAELDQALGRFAEVLARDLAVNVRDQPGAGAAGGLGAGLLAFVGATLAPGIELVLDAVDMTAALTTADLVLTGEGSIDASTAHGKTIAGLAKRASGMARPVPVFAFAGRLGPGCRDVLPIGATALFSLNPAPISLQIAFSHARAHLAAAAEMAVRAFLAGRNRP